MLDMGNEGVVNYAPDGAIPKWSAIAFDSPVPVCCVPERKTLVRKVLTALDNARSRDVLVEATRIVASPNAGLRQQESPPSGLFISSMHRFDDSSSVIPTATTSWSYKYRSISYMGIDTSRQCSMT